MTAVNSEIIIRTDTIVCPECNTAQAADVTWTEGHPWPSFVHTCECGYIILESEWDNVEAEDT